MRKKILIILVLVIIVAGVGFVANYLISVQRYRDQVANISYNNINASVVPNGTYIGEYDADLIYAKVEVAVQNGAITNIVLLEHLHQKGDAAETIVSAIVSQQKVDVDSVSGATNSSTVIKKAVDNALSNGRKNVTAASLPALPVNSPTVENDHTPFSTASPDGAVQIDCVPHENDASLVTVRLVETTNQKTIITYDYPADTEFTALWTMDNWYCAIGYKNKEESRVVIYVTKPGIPTSGLGILSHELSYFADSVHPVDADAHFSPKDFTAESVLVLIIDWLDANGNRNTDKMAWDFEHGTYTKVLY